MMKHTNLFHTVMKKRIWLALTILFCNIALASNPYLHASGYNSNFDLPENTPFSSYIDYKKELIKKYNIHYHNNPQDHDLIMQLNAPYILEGKNCSQYKPIIALTFSSPLRASNSLQDMSKNLQKYCVTTYALMLTGSGTRPGDLLTTRAETWNNEVNYAINRIHTTYPNRPLVVMSEYDSARIALLAALKHPDQIRALVLFQPSIVTRASWKNAKWLRHIRPWFIRTNESNYAEYDSLSFNDVYQKTVSKDQIDRQIKHSGKVRQPVFTTLQYDDFLGKKYRKLTRDNITWLYQHTLIHPFLIYTSDRNNITELIKNTTDTWLTKGLKEKNTRIIKTLRLPTELTVSKDNKYLGVNGRVKGCATKNKDNEYASFHTCDTTKEKNQLPDSSSQPDNHQFYWYNPDFDNMMKHVVDFLNREVRPDQDNT